MRLVSSSPWDTYMYSHAQCGATPSPVRRPRPGMPDTGEPGDDGARHQTSPDDYPKCGSWALAAFLAVHRRTSELFSGPLPARLVPNPWRRDDTRNRPNISTAIDGTTAAHVGLPAHSLRVCACVCDGPLLPVEDGAVAWRAQTACLVPPVRRRMPGSQLIGLRSLVAKQAIGSRGACRRLWVGMRILRLSLCVCLCQAAGGL